MRTIQFRSPVTLPLLKAGTPKPVPPDPRAYQTFRVTQTFGARDAYYGDGRTHGATDIGNFRCGDPVVAMAGGIARRVKDNATALGAPTDALGVLVDHGDGITTEYWHLRQQLVMDGARVAAGSRIGLVGDTGLGRVCHCHIEAKRNGIRFDPEPLMFGGTVTVEEGDDVKIADGKPLVRGTVGPGNRLRSDPNTTEGSVIVGVDAGTEGQSINVQVYQFEVPGEPYELGGVPGAAYAWIGVNKRAWFVAQPLLTDLRVVTDELPAADCSALENRIARASTAVEGAQRALVVAQAALT